MSLYVKEFVLTIGLPISYVLMRECFEGSLLLYLRKL